MKKLIVLSVAVLTAFFFVACTARIDTFESTDAPSDTSDTSFGTPDTAYNTSDTASSGEPDTTTVNPQKILKIKDIVNSKDRIRSLKAFGGTIKDFESQGNLIGNENPQAQQTKSFTVGDKTYDMKYDKSYVYSNSIYSVDYYSSGNSCDLEINPKTNQILTVKDFDNLHSNGAPLDQSQILDLAQKVLASYLPDPQNYTKENCKFISDQNEYYIDYERYIDGYPTSDFAFVDLMADGSLWFYSGTPVSFANVTALPPIDNTEIIPMIDSALKSDYPDLNLKAPAKGKLSTDENGDLREIFTITSIMDNDSTQIQIYSYAVKLAGDIS